MKIYILIISTIIFSFIKASAQDNKAKEIESTGVKIDSLPIVYIDNSITVHFISPEPITYIDISSSKYQGDIPVKNIFRVKHLDSLKSNLNSLSDDAIVTIVGEKFIAQYKLVFLPMNNPQLCKTNIEIVPKDIKSIAIADITMSQNEMKKYSMAIVGRRPRIHSVGSSAYGMQETLNNIFTVGDYIFLDISFENKTNLKYDIDEIRFKVEDKKVTKASTIQSIEVKPDYLFANNPSFKRHFRNVYVFKKFTFPGNKILNVEMTEKQLSGRVISLQIDYSDILNADTL